MKTPEHTPEEPQNDNKLHLTSVSSLLVWAAVCAFCAWLMVSTLSLIHISEPTRQVR